jgi:glycosyltransferase involved in cell wall biosynthesis
MNMEGVNRMRIAVVVPLFNGESHIERAVLSVLQQSRRADEIIIVDDGSTDGGAERVCSDFPGIQIVHQTNRGAGAARNAGVEASTSEWVAFLDADDLWGGEHLRFAEAAMKAFPGAAFVASVSQRRRIPSNRIDRDPAAAVRQVDSLLDRRLIRSAPRIEQVDYFRIAAGRRSPVNSSSVLLRRSIFAEESIAFPTVPLHEDLATWCAVSLSHRLTLIRRATVLVTASSTSASETDRSARAGTAQKDCRAYARRADFKVAERAISVSHQSGTDRKYIERYCDGIVTRHWPTVLLYAEQRCGRQAFRSLRQQWRPQAVLLLIAASFPPPLAKIVAALAQWVARGLNIKFPVSPFAGGEASGSAV